MELDNALLIIEHGEPYSSETTIILKLRETLIGRSWKTHHPDITFKSPLISRNHAIINFQNSHYFITDLASKHGTQINNSNIEPNSAFPLQDGDSIILAKGAAILTFKDLNAIESEDTVELNENRQMLSQYSNSPLTIDLERREVLLEGKSLNLNGKDLELLLFLYQNSNKAVTYDQIRVAVWPERLIQSDNCIPDVGSDELSALVYRLRKRLGQHSSLIKTIPRFGYRLDRQR